MVATALASGCGSDSKGTGVDLDAGTDGAASSATGSPNLDAGADGAASSATSSLASLRGVRASLSPEAASLVDALSASFDSAKTLDAEGLLAAHPVTFASGLGYTPSSAGGMEQIQASSLALGADELAKLDANGFVITEHHTYPNFTYGYREIYAEHLPLYVSADSLLEALHASYDEILKGIESNLLLPAAQTLLDEALAALPNQPASDARADLDVYLTVARSLLSGTQSSPVAGGSADVVSSIVAAATAATGTATVDLFGVGRDEDFSQYKPRGHYTDTTVLQGYFRAMMWLGRIDFRLLESQADGSWALRRRQLQSAFLLQGLLSATAMDSYQRVDQALRGFIGEPDYMTLEQFGQLRTELGVDATGDLSALSDEALEGGLMKVAYGRQRILSALSENDGTTATAPLSLSFALLGQRYVLDSHVLSNVVYDRVPQKADVPLRLMPDPLDVAFAAFGNDAAARLLAAPLRTYAYAPELEQMRLLADSYGNDGATLYQSWTSAIRTLSTSGDVAAQTAAGLPTVATTEPWSRRLLNAQLASWAELRHDTILYAKPSYSSIPACEFPDAFVDPYPKFFSALEAYAARGTEIVSAFTPTTATSTFVQSAASYFSNLATSSATLRQMAEAELAGSALTEAQLTFINQAVSLQKNVCTSDIVGANGWYPQLYFNHLTAIQFKPTIADVHTQPADAAGTTVGNVLHVGTGRPRLMVATIDRCGAPQAYVGLAFSYFEATTKDFTRLTDDVWSQTITTTPDDVPWMKDLVVR